MGHTFGMQEREAIHALYRARLQNAIEQAEQYGGRKVAEADVCTVARRCLPEVRAFAPEGYAELEGIAEGAQLSLERLWAMNALTDLRDVLAYQEDRPADDEGCSSFVILGDRTDDHHPLVAQTWDLATSNMPFVRVVVREPDEGPRTVCLTTVGCLSLIGLNEHGIAVGTTNLRSLDARQGVGYLDVIHRALAQRDFEGAMKVVETAPRAGAHYYMVVEETGRTGLVECSARRFVSTRPSTGVRVHTNHFLDKSLQTLEDESVRGSSSFRRQAYLEDQFARRS